MDFDYAVSFSGNERAIARQIANDLKVHGLNVFFDEHFEHELLGKDGTDYLNDIFFNKSKFCIGLLSASYEKSAWTQLERRAIQAREFITEPGYLVPVLVDDFHPSWLLPTRIYFDLNKRGIDKLVELLVNKIKNSLKVISPSIPAVEEIPPKTTQYKLIEGEIFFHYHTRERITHIKRTIRQALQDNCLGFRSSFRWTGDKIALKNISPGQYIKFLRRTSLHEAYEVTFDIPLDKFETIETKMEWLCEDNQHTAVKMLEAQIHVPMDKMILRVKFPSNHTLSYVNCRIQEANETLKPLKTFTPTISENNELIWEVEKPIYLHFYKVLWNFEGESNESL